MMYYVYPVFVGINEVRLRNKTEKTTFFFVKTFNLGI